MPSRKDKDNNQKADDVVCETTCDAGLRNVVDTRGQKLIDEACKAYGIDRKYVLSSNYHPETEEAVILTCGGSKVRYRKGDKVEPLPAVRVDGIIRKKMRVIAGKKR